MISGYFGGINTLKKHSHYKTKDDKHAPFLKAEYLAELASNQRGRREYREDGHKEKLGRGAGTGRVVARRTFAGPRNLDPGFFHTCVGKWGIKGHGLRHTEDRVRT